LLSCQPIFGAPDLDIAPAGAGAFRSIAEIYVQGKTAVSFLTHNRIEVAPLDGSAPVPANKSPKQVGTPSAPALALQPLWLSTSV
jgi:hypothetical protein